MSMPTIGFPTRGGTGRASVRSQSSPDKSCTLSSGDGRFSLNDLNRAANRVSPLASLRSFSSRFRKSALTATNGLQRLISRH